MSTDSLKSKIIQKAWEDPQFKAKLLADPKSALKDEFGLDVPEGIEVTAVEETASRYYLVIPPDPADLKSADSNAPEYVWG